MRPGAREPGCVLIYGYARLASRDRRREQGMRTAQNQLVMNSSTLVLIRVIHYSNMHFVQNYSEILLNSVYCNPLRGSTFNDELPYFQS